MVPADARCGVNPSPFLNMYYFYLLQSIKKPNEIYTGSTNNLRLRFREHNQGKVFSTKRYLPWKLIYYEAYLSEKDARLREQKFKRHGKGNQELKKRLENSLHFFKKGEGGLPLTISPKKGESKGSPLTFLGKKGEGFTLPELLVSIAVMAVLSTLALADFHRGQYGNDLQASAQELVSAIRSVQSMAMAGLVTIHNTVPTVPPGGYGVSITSSSGQFEQQAGYVDINGTAQGFTEFADFESWNDTTSSCDAAPNQLFDYADLGDRHLCNDQKIGQGSVALKSNVIIRTMRLSHWCPFDLTALGIIASNPIDVTFKPPQPIPYIVGCPGTIMIELDHLQTHQCRTVTIDAISGNVSERMGPIEGSKCQSELDEEE